MGERNSPARDVSEKRKFGLGDILVYVGTIFNSVLLIILLANGVEQDRAWDDLGGWLIAAIAVLLAMHVLVGIAQMLSLSNSRWFLVPLFFAGFLGLGFLTGIAPFKGSSLEFFFLLGASLIAIGVWLAERSIGSLITVGVPSEVGPHIRLAQLKRMRDENLVSEEEYERKRQEILNRL